jgi:hypothetical protein
MQFQLHYLTEHDIHKIIHINQYIISKLNIFELFSCDARASILINCNTFVSSLAVISASQTQFSHLIQRVER